MQRLRPPPPARPVGPQGRPAIIGFQRAQALEILHRHDGTELPAMTRQYDAFAPQPARPPYDANWANYDTAEEINPHIRFRASSYQSVADIRTSPDALWVREAIKNHPGLQRHVKQQA